MLKTLIRFINRAECFFYKYTPRFTTGYCLVTKGKKYHTFEIVVPGIKTTMHSNQYLVKAKYFNWFGEVFEPTVIEAYQFKK